MAQPRAKRFAGPKIINKIEALLLNSALKQNGHKELRLLVTGKTGEGKSTLVNGILGKHVAKEGASATRCTTEVTEYKGELHGVPVTVFDSPGLQDITENEDQYIADMKKKCKNLTLVLYCSKMTNNRLKDDDRYAMLKLTAAFGQRFWEHTVFVLTFANHENVTRRDDRDEDEGPEPDDDDDAAWEELEKKRFEGRLKKWKECLYKFLTDHVGVQRDIVEKIPVVPAGDHRKSRENMKPFRLPDRENWFSEIWKAFSLRMREMNLFFKILNKHRIVFADEAIQTHPCAAMGPVEKLFEEPLAQNRTLQPTDISAVVDTCVAKLQESIKKIYKEAWVKEQKEKVRKEREEIKRQAEESRRKEIEKQEKKIKREEEEAYRKERQEMKDVEKVPVLVMQPNKEENDSKSKDGAMAKPQSVKELKKIFQSQEKQQPTFTPTKLRLTNSVSHLCHPTPPFPETWAPDNHKELKLLVTGKTGVGKSTLVNGILGAEVAKEGAGKERVTTEVTEYKGELHGVPVTVFDSPGLQDITGHEDQYIADMKKKCKNLTLVLYCSKMTNSCLKDEDRYAILKLTAAFGQRFWEFAVLVLTFANHEDVTRRDDRDEDEGPEPDYDDAAWEELEKKRFEDRVKIWKEGFYKFLIDEVRVQRDITEKIPVVPAGDHRETKENRTPLRLPDRENWFDEFWKASSLKMKGKSYQLKELEHKIEMQAGERKRKELEKQAEEYKKKIDEYNRLEEKKMAKESTQLDLLLDKKPQKSDLFRLFKSSAAHYMIIGTALDVEVGDLPPTPGTAATHLMIVFQRWIDSNNDMTWSKIVQVCEDYPKELGRVKAEVKGFLSSDRARDNYL